MIDRRLQILNQRAIAPDIQGLRAVADAKDRLVQVEGVLQQQLIGGGARRGQPRRTQGWRFAISLRIHVKAAAGQQDSLHARQKLGHAFLPLVERHNHRRRSGSLQRAQDMRQERPLYSWSVLVGSGMAMRLAMNPV